MRAHGLRCLMTFCVAASPRKKEPLRQQKFSTHLVEDKTIPQQNIYLKTYVELVI
jgi:hypothetical protein